MNKIVGHDKVGDRSFPRFSGPCKGCGAENYGLSTSGPDYCGACACGVDPKLSQLQHRYNELFDRYMDTSLALGLTTGHFPPFNEITQKRAEELLSRRKAEWLEKNPGRN